jgi:hypothetical protein
MLINVQGSTAGNSVSPTKQSNTHREKVLEQWTAFLGRPVALIGEQRHQTFGRRDIVGWLETVHVSQLPWRRVTLAA